MAGVTENTIGEWLIGPFMYDPSDDSLFWEETHMLSGNVRLGCTGPYREGIYVGGVLLVPPAVIPIPAMPDEARELYFEIAREIVRRVLEDGN